MIYETQLEVKRKQIPSAGHKALWIWTKELTKKKAYMENYKVCGVGGGGAPKFM